ncbi:DUF6760 family protein [Thermomonospora amylolytica]|uniref:DUF6760 family protein n=1 Tax=Thermomonospora amylolytica TaxID=1411117 RepID=UPI000E6C13E1|nr:DUF6760 family protein [Thermomonospora amylolytica]
MTSTVVHLPGGLHDAEGRRHREAELMPLRGREEELLAGASRGTAELVTAVLAGRLRRIGSIAPVTEGTARDLTVGDRQFLLLKLREITFGPDVAAVVSCPWPACGKKMDAGFRIPDVPVRSGGDGPLFDLELSREAAPVDGGRAHRRVRFRLPTGGDQEALAGLVDGDPAGALRALLERCVVAIGPARPPEAGWSETLSPRARAEIERAMAAVAPGPELTMDARCPECGRTFTLPFEVADFFFGEVHASTDLLYREVHYLAYHYHWSEAEILGLPMDKRRRYIELLGEHIERLNDAVG